MKKVFFGDWEKEGVEQMKRDFEITDAALKGARILFASYVYESYEGDAFVMFKRAGKLYEVHGGHCSCNGLEGQWYPEETTKSALLDRIQKGYSYGVIAQNKEEIIEAINCLRSK